MTSKLDVTMAGQTALMAALSKAPRPPPNKDGHNSVSNSVRSVRFKAASSTTKRGIDFTQYGDGDGVEDYDDVAIEDMREKDEELVRALPDTVAPTNRDNEDAAQRQAQQDAEEGELALAEKLMRDRKDRHAEALHVLDANLAQINDTINEKLVALCTSVKQRVSEADEDALTTLMQICNSSNLAQFTWETVENTREIVHAELHSVDALILSLAEKFANLEEDRHAKISAVLREARKHICAVAFLLPPEVDKLIFERSAAINRDLLDNARVCVELKALLQQGRVSMRCKCDVEWSILVEKWKKEKETVLLKQAIIDIANLTDYDVARCAILEEFSSQLETIISERMDLMVAASRVTLDKEAPSLAFWRAKMEDVHRDYFEIYQSIKNDLEGVTQELQSRVNDVIIELRETLTEQHVCDPERTNLLIEQELKTVAMRTITGAMRETKRFLNALDDVSSTFHEEAEALEEICKNLSSEHAHLAVKISDYQNDIRQNLHEKRAELAERQGDVEAGLDTFVDNLRQASSQQEMADIKKTITGHLDSGLQLLTQYGEEAKRVPLPLIKKTEAAYQAYLERIEALLGVAPSPRNSARGVDSRYLIEIDRPTPATYRMRKRRWKPTQIGSHKAKNRGGSASIVRDSDREEMVATGSQRHGSTISVDTSASEEGSSVVEIDDAARIAHGDMDEVTVHSRRSSRSGDPGQYTSSFLASEVPCNNIISEIGTVLPETEEDDGTDEAVEARTSSRQSSAAARKDNAGKDARARRARSGLTREEHAKLDFLAGAVVHPVLPRTCLKSDGLTRTIIADLKLDESHALQIWRAICQEWLSSALHDTHSATDVAKKFVQERQREAAAEVSAAVEMHNSRSQRIEAEVHNVRAAELILHQHRVLTHSQAIAAALQKERERATIARENIREGAENFLGNLELRRVELASKASLDQLDKHRKLTVREFEDYRTDLRRTLIAFKKSCEGSFKSLKQSNAAFRSSFKSFTQNGNFSSEEITRYKKVIEKVFTQIELTDQEIQEDLEGLETEFMKTASDTLDVFHAELTVHLRDVQLLDSTHKLISNCKVVVQSEINACEQGARELKNHFAQLQSARDDKQGSVEDLFRIMDKISTLTNERARFLNCVRPGASHTKSGGRTSAKPSDTHLSALMNGPPRKSASRSGRNTVPVALRGIRLVVEDWHAGPEKTFMHNITSARIKCRQKALQVAAPYYEKGFARTTMRPLQIKETIQLYMDGVQDVLNGLHRTAAEHYRQSVEELVSVMEQTNEIFMASTVDIFQTMTQRNIEKHRDASMHLLASGLHAKVEEWGAIYEMHMTQLKPRLAQPAQREELDSLIGSENEREELFDALCSRILDDGTALDDKLIDEYTQEMNTMVQKLCVVFENVLAPTELFIPSEDPNVVPEHASMREKGRFPLIVNGQVLSAKHRKSRSAHGVGILVTVLHTEAMKARNIGVDLAHAHYEEEEAARAEAVRKARAALSLQKTTWEKSIEKLRGLVHA